MSDPDKAAKRRAYWARRVARGGLSRGQQKRADYHKRMAKKVDCSIEEAPRSNQAPAKGEYPNT